MIADRMIDQAYAELKSACGGNRNDYLGLLYLEQEHGVPREKACNQIAFGGNDYGLDGFHFDEKKHNLYLYQFKNSPSHTLFKESMQRLITVGVERIFSAPNKDDAKNQVILQLRSCMIDNRALVDQIIFRFVFTGDTEEAERSLALDKLREDLEEKRYYVHEFFKGREVSFLVQFRSTSGRVGDTPEPPKNYQYDLDVGQILGHDGPDGQRMAIGFIRLVDLHRMYRDIGPRFFERNIRFGLGSGEAVNRALLNALRRIVLDAEELPSVFAFDHNGITLSAERIEPADGHWHITAPRLLNGAQTTTTFGEFVDSNADNPAFREAKERLEGLRVLCKIITHATSEFISRVTINNNRQNPVEPWNLHANDLIQLALHDKFRTELRNAIYYERQESAFEGLSQEELEREGYIEAKAIEMQKLAQTFLVSDGQIDKLSRMRLVFEDERTYIQVFNDGRLRADARHLVLCYKVQLRLRKVVNEVVQKGYNKYWWIDRARGLIWALLCQGLLNDEGIEEKAERFGHDMSVPAEFTAALVQMATTRCRPLLAHLVTDPTYAEKVAEEKMGFLRTNAAYKKCMDEAYKRWRWVEKRLK